MGYQDIIATLSLAVSVLVGVVTLLGFLNVSKKIQANGGVFYGNEAKKRFDKIKGDLTDGNLAEEYEFEGGRSKIFPQIRFERLDHRKMEVDSKYRRCTEIVTYHVAENGRRMVRVWYL